MKVEKQLTDFIEMRIEGKSFDDIAKAMNIAKSTLIDWNKKAVTRTSIAEGKAFALNTIIKAFEYNRQNRLKTMLVLSKKINDELLSRDLSDISSDKLLQMTIANDDRLLKTLNSKIEIGENKDIISFSSGDGFFNYGLDD